MSPLKQFNTEVKGENTHHKYSTTQKIQSQEVYKTMISFKDYIVRYIRERSPVLSFII